MTVRVHTPWGTRRHLLTADSVRVLGVIDGVNTASVVHQRHLAAMAAPLFTDVLLRLRRAGVIDLRAVTVGAIGNGG